jgi:hypothetical protein
MRVGTASLRLGMRTGVRFGDGMSGDEPDITAKVCSRPVAETVALLTEMVTARNRRSSSTASPTPSSLADVPAGLVQKIWPTG